MHLAESAVRVGARLVHVSTDVVFDGEHAPYQEDSIVSPLHRYGASKAQAERAVIESGADAVIARTSLIYGFDPLDPRTRATLEGKMNRLFVDEFRNPVFAGDLADALIELSTSEYRGVLHVAGPQRLNRYEFGVKSVQALGGDWTKLVPSLTTESPLVRPRDCTLDISRAQRVLKTELRGVEQVLFALNGRDLS
jgi:dTDP-4-dehydrorhamnose reductase